MNSIDLKNEIESKIPGYFDKYPNIVQKLFIKFLEKITHLNEINNFFNENLDKKNELLIDEIFEYLDFTYTLSHKDIRKIPREGKVIIAANHPLGGLDGLSILRAIKDVRKDVKIIANDLLTNLGNLKEMIIPYDVSTDKNIQQSYMNIKESLQNEEAVIIFPAAEASRFHLNGIKDNKWKKGVIHFSLATDAPVLPIYVNARNSVLFYLVGLLSSKLSMVMLPREVFKKKGKLITLKIGNQIPSDAFKTLKKNESTYLLRKHVYSIGKKNKKKNDGIFRTEKTPIQPLDKDILVDEINKIETLGTTHDNKKIMFFSHNESKYIMQEIGRLREITFRTVGEGTGNRIDKDIYDTYYKHLIIWDEYNSEIIGSYRIGFGDEIYKNYGKKGFYTSTLFNFNKNFESYFPYTIELGRSFIQKKYWGSKALEYLWFGIGMLIAKNPKIKFLIGPVSISNSYIKEAKDLLIFFYSNWFKDWKSYATAKNRYLISEKNEEELNNFFSLNDYDEDFKKLRNMLRNYQASVPILYKQYVDLCIQGGVKILDFSVDPSFNNCIDGLFLVDLDYLTPSKKEKYIERFRKEVVQ